MSDLGEAPSSRFDALGFQSFKSDLRQRSLLTVSVATLNAVAVADGPTVHTQVQETPIP